jgi:hypothetical protein
MLGSLLFSLEISAVWLSVDKKVRQVPAEIGIAGWQRFKEDKHGWRRAWYLHLLFQLEAEESLTACGELLAWPHCLLS